MAEKNNAPAPEVKEGPTFRHAEKTVKIRVPKTREHQEDVFVQINQRNWLIKRGETVEVPECVQEALRHQEEMLETIMEFEDANAQK